MRSPSRTSAGAETETLPPLTRHRPSLTALTGIRFLAAIYVIVFHTGLGSQLTDHGHPIVGTFIHNGFLAVPLFFILSGFILAYTYQGHLAQPGDYRRFYEARFARIWPVYMLSLLLASVPSLRFPPLGRALAAVFMLQSWSPWDLQLAGVWNFVCWTLSAEAFFYLVFPPLQAWLQKLTTSSLLLFSAATIASCVLFDTVTRTLGSTPSGVYRFIPLALCHLPEFIAGVTCGNLLLRRLRTPAHASSPLLFVSGAFSWVAALASAFVLCLTPNRWTSIVILAFSSLLFGLAAERTLLSRALSTPLMVLGGGISYSVYLLQLSVKTWTGIIIEHTKISSEAFRFLCSLTMLLVLSYLLFTFFENPARKVLRNLFSRIEQLRGSRVGSVSH